VITRSLIFAGLLFLSTVACADANDGEYLGFKLGSIFAASEGAIRREHTTGALVYIVNPHQRHQHLGSLSIYVTPKSSIIGSVFGDWYFSSKQTAQQFSDRYMQTLQTTYSSWKRGRNTLTDADYQLWVDLEQKPPIVDHWPSDKKFRVSVALIYAPGSTQRNAWMTLVKRESKTRD
jgi:hypothetical protein